MAIRVYWRLRAGTAFQKAPDGLTQGEYWLRYAQDGKQRWERVGDWGKVSKAIVLLNRRLEKERVAKAYGLVAPSTEKRLSIPAAVASYIQRKVLTGKRPATIRVYQNTLAIFKEWCPRLYVDEVTGDDLLDFVDFCKKRGDSERTKFNRFVDVTAFLNFHGKSNLVATNDRPQYTQRLVEAYTQKELDGCYAAVKTDKEKVLLDLLIYTGFRNGEIAHLTWDDITWSKNSIAVKPKPLWNWEPKTHECRSIRVPRKVMVSLRFWRRYHGGHKLLFPTRELTPDDHQLRIIKDLAKRAGIKTRVDEHKFRATAATRWVKTFRVQDVQKMLGHKSILTTMRYLAATDQDSAEFVEKIEASK